MSHLSVMFIKYIKLVCFEVGMMSNLFPGEDVEKLLDQLQKYRRIIRNYQENDLSLDYSRLKLEVKELRAKLADSKQKIAQMEKKQKDNLFDYYKVLEERRRLQQEVEKLRNEIHFNHSRSSQNEKNYFSLTEKDLEKVAVILQESLLNLIDAKVYKLEEGNLTIEKKQGVKSEIVFPNRKESHEKMEREENNLEVNTSSIIKSDKDTNSNVQIGNESGRRAETNNEKNNLSSTSIGKSNEKTGHRTFSIHQPESQHVPPTLITIQNQITEIKKLLEERKPKETPFPRQQRPHNPLLRGNSHKTSNPTRSKEFTFRDLQGATNVSQIIEVGAKKDINLFKNQQIPQAKEGRKPVYIRNTRNKNATYQGSLEHKDMDINGKMIQDSKMDTIIGNKKFELKGNSNAEASQDKISNVEKNYETNQVETSNVVNNQETINSVLATEDTTKKSEERTIHKEQKVIELKGENKDKRDGETISVHSMTEEENHENQKTSQKRSLWQKITRLFRKN